MMYRKESYVLGEERFWERTATIYACVVFSAFLAEFGNSIFRVIKFSNFLFIFSNISFGFDENPASNPGRKGSSRCEEKCKFEFPAKICATKCFPSIFRGITEGCFKRLLG